MRAEHIRKTEYAKALNRIEELETDIANLVKDNNRQQDLIVHLEKRIEELEDKTIILEDENTEMRAELDAGIVVPCSSIMDEIRVEAML